jgi:hypothetical protein
MFCVIGLVAWAIIGLPFLYGPSPRLAESSHPPQTHSEQSAQHSTAKPDGSEAAPFFIRIPKTAEEAAQEAEDRKDKAATDWWLMVFTGAVALFTLLLVGATVLLYKAGEKQRASSERIAADANAVSRETLNASRRAWLSVDDVKFVHPTRFTEDGFIFRASATIKNLGQTPAMAVWVGFETFYSENGERYVDARHRITTNARQHPGVGGVTIFPQDTLVQTELFGDAKEVVAKAINTRPDGQRKAGLMLFVTVSYKIIGDKDRHITHHVHDFLNIPMGLMVADGQSIDLPAQPFLAGEID